MAKILAPSFEPLIIAVGKQIRQLQYNLSHLLYKIRIR
jgi:hypothetical protein